MVLKLTETAAGVTFAVKAVPGSSRDRIVGVHGGALKITVTAPPERGKANERIVALLATALSLPTSSIALVAGASSAHKLARVTGITATEVARRLGLG